MIATTVTTDATAAPMTTGATAAGAMLSSTPFFADLRESFALLATGNDAPARIASACATPPNVSARAAKLATTIFDVIMMSSPSNVNFSFKVLRDFI